MRTLRVGIVGCGGIAVSKHMPALAKSKAVEMAAFCDILPERAREAAKSYGAPDAEVFDKYDDLLALDLDIVYVLTPNNSHAPIAVAAMEAGKHVMCEKPMATGTREARAMVDTARRTGRKLTIGYQNRFRQDSLYLKRCVEAGDLGEIYYARAQAIRRRGVPTWGVFLDGDLQGGGPLIDIGTHALDLTLWCMDNYEPEFVVGATYHKLAPRPDSANIFGPWDPEKFTVEDSAFGFVRMKSGATIYLEAAWALNTLDVHEGKTILCGTEGGADMMGEAGALRLNGERFSKLYVSEPSLEAGEVQFYAGATDTPADLECRMWLAHVRDDNAPLITKPEQALVVTQILEAMYASAGSGKPVWL